MRVGIDSLKHVDFVGCVEVRVRGFGESSYVLPSHPVWDARIETTTLSPPVKRHTYKEEKPCGCVVFHFTFPKKLYNKYIKLIE